MRGEARKPIEIDGSWEGYVHGLDEADKWLSEYPRMRENSTLEFRVSVDDHNVLNLANLVLWVRERPVQRPVNLVVSASKHVWWNCVLPFLNSEEIHELLNLSIGTPRPSWPFSGQSWEAIQWWKASPRERPELPGWILPPLTVNYETLAFMKQPLQDVLDSEFQLKRSPDEYQQTDLVIVRKCRTLLVTPFADDDLIVRRAVSRLGQWVREKEFRDDNSAIPIRAMPMMSFLVYCAMKRLSVTQDARLRNSPVVPTDAELEANDDVMMMDSLDVAESLVQFAENTVFHSKAGPEELGQGVMCLRIHPQSGTTQPATAQCLSKTYPLYLEGHDHRRPESGEGESSWEIASHSSLNGTEVEMDQKRLEEIQKNHDKIQTRQEKRGRRAFFEAHVLDRSNRAVVDTFRNQYPEYSMPRLRDFFDPDMSAIEEWRKFSESRDIDGTSRAIHHYGLQISEALIRGADGCLVVTSQGSPNPLDLNNVYTSSGDALEENDALSCVKKAVIPGTQIRLLMPIKASEKADLTDQTKMYHVDVDYTVANPENLRKDLRADEVVRTFMTDVKGIGQFQWKSNSKKKDFIRDGIRSLTEDVQNFCQQNGIEEFSDVLVFDAWTIPLGVGIEVFAKCVAGWIAQRHQPGQAIKTLVAVTNCDRFRFVSLARLFATFYDRTGRIDWMEGAQIYLVGNNPHDELWLAGGNLRQSLAAQIKLSVAREVGGHMGHPLTDLLVRMLLRFTSHPDQNDDSRQLEFAPFDLVVKKNGGRRIFDWIVNAVLEEQLDAPKDSGSHISTHVRIGSKVHQNEFYEAELLFSNEYYIERYAALVVEKLSHYGIHANTDTLFIGYGTYVAKLLSRLCRQDDPRRESAHREGSHWFYGIFDPPEYSVEERPKIKRLPNIYYPHDVTKKSLRLVLLTCINSTMSTFRKLLLEFQRDLPKKDFTLKDGQIIRLNLVRVRDDDGRSEDMTHLSTIEKRFFKEQGAEFVVLVPDEEISALEEPVRIDCFHAVWASWSDPLLCGQCYPLESRMADEVPLVGTRGSGVVIDQVFGVVPSVGEPK